MEIKVPLGSTVRDRVSGFTGLVIGYTVFISGCDRVLVAPRELDKDGKVQDDRWFDAQMVETVGGKPLFTVENEKPGGGRNHVPRADATR